MSQYLPLYMRLSSSKDRAAFWGPDAIVVDKTTVYSEPALNQMVAQASLQQAIENASHWEQLVLYSEASAVDQCIFNAYLGRMTAKELKRVRLQFSKASLREGAYLLFWILWVIEPLYPSGFLPPKDDERSCEQQLQVLLNLLDFSPPQEEALFFKLLLFKSTWIKKLPLDDLMTKKWPNQLLYWAFYGLNEMVQGAPDIQGDSLTLPIQPLALLENNPTNLSVWGMVFLKIYPYDFRFLRSLINTLHFNIYNGLRVYFHQFPEHLRALHGLGLKHTPLSLSRFLHIEDDTLQFKALSLILDVWLEREYLDWDQNDCLVELLQEKKPIVIEKLTKAKLKRTVADHILSHWCKYYDHNSALPGLEKMKDPHLAEMFSHLIASANWQQWVDLLDPSKSDEHLSISDYQEYILLHQYTWSRNRRQSLLNTLVMQHKWRALTFVFFYCLQENTDFEKEEISHWLERWTQSATCFSESLLYDTVNEIDRSNFPKGSSAILIKTLKAFSLTLHKPEDKRILKQQLQKLNTP